MTLRYRHSPIVLALCFAWSCGFWDHKTANACNGAVTAPMSAQNATISDGATSSPIASGSAGSVSTSTAVGGSAVPTTPVVTGSAPTANTSASATAGNGATGTTPSVTAGSSAPGAMMLATAGSVSAPEMPAAAGGGALPPGGMQCRNEACAPLPEATPEAVAAGFDIKPCCSAEGDCGTSLNGAECIRTVDSFAGCPALSAMGFDVPSCCTADGKCGLDGSSFMMGCMSLEDVSVQAGAFIEVPAPAPCTPTSM